MQRWWSGGGGGRVDTSLFLVTQNTLIFYLSNAPLPFVLFISTSPWEVTCALKSSGWGGKCLVPSRQLFREAVFLQMIVCLTSQPESYRDRYLDYAN